MRKAIFATILVLGLVLVAGAAPYQNLVQGIFFSDVGGNNATAGIVYTRVSDNETLEFQFTTSDTVEYTLDATNFYLAAGNTMVFEGSGVDDFETTISAANVTADVTLSLPLSNAANAAFMVSDLVTNSPEIANSVWGRSNALVWEGSGADNFESIMSSDDVAQDVAYTLRDISSGVYTVGAFTHTYCTGPLFTGSVDVIVFLADRAYTVTKIDYIHQVKEAAGTLTVEPQRLQGTEDVSAGDNLIQAAFNAASIVNNTTTSSTLTATTAFLTLAAGDRLALDFTDDVAGELANVCVTFNLVPD